MPSEADWLNKVKHLTSESGKDEPSFEHIRLVEEGLREHPRSARLWNLRGDLIQLVEDDQTLESYSLDDARDSYEHARAAAPDDPEAYESLGHFFDAVDEQLDIAATMFRSAIERGGGAGAWAGLARVLTQLGRRDDALKLLLRSACPYAGSPR
jgi:tetratricopeptide (TPR) repeat protein